MSQFLNSLNQNIEMFKNMEKDSKKIIKLARILSKFCKKKNSKLIVCGNGGSATDADHFVTELVVRFKKNRKSIPAISLSSNPGLITACANDYNFSYIFKRQIESLANKNDCILFISTSGKSQNIIEAAQYSKNNKIFSISLTGKDGGDLKKLTDENYTVRSNSVARIQEAHIFLLHFFCEYIDDKF